MSHQENIAAATENLASLVQEARIAQTRLNEIEAEKKQIESRLHELTGGWGGRGLILAAKHKLITAEQEAKDATKREVKWVKDKPGFEVAEFIVDKVTAKRIYVRRRGRKDSEFYNHDGEKHQYGCKIDVAATFPEGLDNYVQDK
jgi:hypothetical protein